MRFALYRSIVDPPRREHLGRAIGGVLAGAQLVEACRFVACFVRDPYKDQGGLLSSPRSAATTAGRRAGRTADGFVGTASTGMENATALATIYREAAREAGRPAQVIQMRDAWVAATRAEADAVYGPHVMAAYRYYWENKLAEFRMISADT